VLEERLRGREVSMMALCDGERLALLASAEDHKAVFDGDRGPNTGGMGTYSPSPLVDEAVRRDIVARIFAPTVAKLNGMGRSFRGLLYAGLMLTPDRGPMVIEWNCRFGDPETQVVLVRMRDDLWPWLDGAARGRLPPGEPAFGPEAAVCVVLAAASYPGAPRTGDPISGLDGRAAADEDRAGVWVFHAGTRREVPGAGDGGGVGVGVGDRLVTAGGRVLGITARAGDLAAARAKAYGSIGTGPGEIGFPGMHFRHDIGMRGEP
jgi:phosphoribosylamine--glycine ligase